MPSTNRDAISPRCVGTSDPVRVDKSLPIDQGASGWKRQRAAASRNEQAIVAAAARLFQREGVDDVEVRDIAAAAGVGVGTVYRRFGDKASVIAAVIGEQERQLQDALLSGPPPLGPGAPPGERLDAFLRALSQLTEANLDIIAASENASPGARYRIGAYQAWRLHITILLRSIDAHLDADWSAELLLAPLAAALYRQQRREQDMSAERITDNLLDAARRLTTSRTSPPPAPLPTTGAAPPTRRS